MIVDGPITQHREQRASRTIACVIVHDPGVDQPRAAVVARAMAMGANAVSYHRIIDAEQEVICVPDHDIAWHAGARIRPEWSAKTGLYGYAANEHSIGLCFTLACPYLTAVDAAGRMCEAHSLPASAVYAHREQATSRTDPRILPDMDAFRADVARWLEPSNQ